MLRLTILAATIVVIGCHRDPDGGAGSFPPVVDAGSRERMSAMTADAAGVFWLQAGGDDAAGDLRVVGEIGRTLLVEGDVATFLDVVARGNVHRAGFLCSPGALGKLDARLRMEVLGAVDAGDAGPIVAICRLAHEPSPAELNAITASGATMITRSGRIATVSGPTVAIARVAELDLVTRLDGESSLDPF